MKYLTRIYGKIPNTNIEIDIPLNGKNLILTGRNGSGKTSFLRGLQENLSLTFEKKIDRLSEIHRIIKHFSSELETHTPGSFQYSDAKEGLIRNQKRLEELQTPIASEIENSLPLCIKYDEFQAIFKFFEAMRTSSITHTTSSTSIEDKKASIKNNIHEQYNNLSTELEQHLLNIRVQKSLTTTESNNPEKAKTLASWFEHFDHQLKVLFENDNVHLQFEHAKMKHYISDGNQKSTFQDLSSGYQAIFQIYADLLMRTEFYDITPADLEGIVLIDEIDVHLHISLQKLILPFFTNAFPNLQFIVSTHSPFVITSADNNTTVYDLSSQEYIEEDLSLYSHEAIVQGLFHVGTKSENLDELTTKLENLIHNEQNLNYSEIRETATKLQKNLNSIPAQSRAVYYQTLNLLVDKNELGDLDV